MLLVIYYDIDIVEKLFIKCKLLIIRYLSKYFLEILYKKTSMSK